MKSFDAVSTQGGTIALDDNGTPGDPCDDKLVYTPPLNYNGPDDFDYAASDNTLCSSSATVTINLAAVNDKPTAADNTVATNEDIDHVFNAAEFNFSDIDGGSLTWVFLSTIPGTGTLSGS